MRQRQNASPERPPRKAQISSSCDWTMSELWDCRQSANWRTASAGEPSRRFARGAKGAHRTWILLNARRFSGRFAVRASRMSTSSSKRTAKTSGRLGGSHRTIERRSSCPITSRRLRRRNGFRRPSIPSTMHEAALAALGLPAAYLPFDIPPEALDPFLLSAERLRIRGFNVTSPHKEAVARSVDELDGDAERLGVVNTVVLRDGWTAGHNTDVYGFRISLRSLGLRVGDRNALVVGAGGAAKAIVDVLLREGAHVQLTNRTPSRAEALAESFDDRIEVLPLGILTRKGPWDLLVNATPVGTKGVPDFLPVPEAVIGKAGFIYDLVYNPPVTPLLRAAKRLNRPGASGLEMLVHQGAKAFELWTGQAAPFGAMELAAKEALQ